MGRASLVPLLETGEKLVQADAVVNMVSTLCFLASGVIALAARPTFRDLEEEMNRKPSELTVP